MQFPIEIVASHRRPQFRRVASRDGRRGLSHVRNKANKGAEDKRALFPHGPIDARARAASAMHRVTGGPSLQRPFPLPPRQSLRVAVRENGNGEGV